MKKIIFILITSLVMMSCGNKTNSIKNHENVEPYIEYGTNNTFSIAEADTISFEKTVKTTVIWNTDANKDDCYISIHDSIVNLKYSSIDNVLHVNYNGQDHIFKNITMSKYTFYFKGIEVDCTLFTCDNTITFTNDTILLYRNVEIVNEETIFMDRTIY